ncbi:hypothetical protein V2J09_021423, partial [Rumex salicifolius]
HANRQVDTCADTLHKNTLWKASTISSTRRQHASSAHSSPTLSLSLLQLQLTAAEIKQILQGAVQDIGVSAAVNLLSALAFLIVFAIARLQPVNDRVYFPKWYLKGIRNSPTYSRGYVGKFVNIDWRMYVRFLNWMPQALRMPEPELIEHAGLDSVAYIRIYLLGLKVFVPIAVLAFSILVPVNWTGKLLGNTPDLNYSNIDRLSISNIHPGSNRLAKFILPDYLRTFWHVKKRLILSKHAQFLFWAHILMCYVFTFWTLYMLYKEYEIITTMRLRFLAQADRRPDRFTVLVRNVPPDPDESISEHGSSSLLLSPYFPIE